MGSQHSANAAITDIVAFPDQIKVSRDARAF